MKRFVQNPLRILGGIGALATLTYLSAFVYVASQASIDERRHTDAIVVLGARAILDGKINPCLMARVKHAVTLYRAGYASTIVVSGGNDVEDGVNEAKTMAEIARNAGIPATALILETRATNTFENLKFSSTLLNERKLNSMLIVSEAYHLPRANLIARYLRLVAYVSPSPESPCSQAGILSLAFLREPLALFKNKLDGQW